MSGRLRIVVALALTVLSRDSRSVGRSPHRDVSLDLRGKKGRQPDVDLAETDEARSVRSTLGDRRGAE